MIRGQQTHEKLEKIRRAVDKWDDQFRRAAAPQPSLESFTRQRQGLMSYLKGEIGSTLVQPFLAPDWEPPLLRVLPYARMVPGPRQHGRGGQGQQVLSWGPVAN